MTTSPFQTTTTSPLTAELAGELEQLKRDRVYKRLNYLDSPQAARVQMEGRGEVLIMSSNNYLGLCSEPTVIEAGIAGLRRYGAGTASVRFICGTFTIHRTLEAALARFVGAESSLSFLSAWNANEALTPSILREGDFVASDALNHASIIDSIPLAKAITKCTTAVYRHDDLDDLVAKLESARTAPRKVIWTDGIFSMEGSIARLPDILDIARRFGATVCSTIHTRRACWARPARDGGALRCVGRSRRHHLHAGKSARRRVGRIRGRPGSALRHVDPAIETATLFERAAADRRGERAGRGRIRGAPPGARAQAAGQCALFSRADHRGGVFTDPRRDSHCPDHCRRDRDCDPHE